MEMTTALEPWDRSVGMARSFVLESIGSDENQDRVSLIVLLASELVSNAVLHARSDLSVTVRRFADCIRVEVYDGNPLLPQPCLPPAEATSGRGLGLVDAMASAWGAERCRDGKVVWFEL